MTDVPAAYSFLAWLRRGLSGYITREDGQGPSSTRIQLPAEIALNAGNASIQVSLLGPGDITGFDPRVVVRTWPRDGVHDAEPNYFPMCEFSEPDLPWRYTPAKASSQDRLRPWISLVVLADDEIESHVAAGKGAKLPIVTVKATAPLPDLNQSWAWAHTQVSGAKTIDSATATGQLTTEPERFASRLLSPRHLRTGASYTAFVVPAFEQGRLSGLDDQVPNDLDGLVPAWDNSRTQSLDLPVYFQWRFQTSTGGDFEYLVRLLEGRPIPDTTGIRYMDASDPGGNLPRPSEGTRILGIEGALKVPATKVPPWDDADRGDFIEAPDGLRKFLNLPADLLSGSDSEIVVAPPLYGSWYAGEDRILAGQGYQWFEELNIDPRQRVPAGLGTAIVQSQQQQLMASAWVQAEGLQRVNQSLRFAQLSRELSYRIFENHLGRIEPESFIQITSPLHSRVKASATTLHAVLQQSSVTGGVLDPQFRRVSRPLGPQGRRQGRETGAAQFGILGRTNRRELAPAALPSTPSVMATIKRSSGSLLPGWASPGTRRLLSVLPTALWAIGVLFLILSSLLFLRSGLNLIAGATTALGIAALKGSASLRSSSTGLAYAAKLQAGTLNSEDIRNAPSRADFVAVESMRSQSRLPPPNPPQARLPGSGGALATLEPSIEKERSEAPSAPSPDVKGRNVRSRPGTDSPSARAFRSATSRMFSQFKASPAPPTERPQADLSTIQKSLVKALDPGVNITAGVMGRLRAPASVLSKRADPLNSIQVGPEFSQAMYKSLSDLSHDWLLPGLDHLPNNTVSLVQSNQRFIESFMVGLNHEMERELLWNEFPTSRKNTYFRQFWDTAGAAVPVGQTGAVEGLKDIQPIATWGANMLGSNSGRRLGSGGDPLVLLIRGDLIRRYPNVEVYAVKARWGNDGKRWLGTGESHPIFTGTLPPDVLFFGFDLGLREVCGTSEPQDNAGWFFVLQEHTSEPRFGLDLPQGPASPMASWNDFSWAHLVDEVAKLDAFEYIDLSAELPDVRNVSDLGGPGAVWHADARAGSRGSTAADIAYVTLQRPVRVAIHASDMLPPPPEGS